MTLSLPDMLTYLLLALGGLVAFTVSTLAGGGGALILIPIVTYLVGATGPILNPFYLNAGIVKEEMVGTKTANSFLVGLVKIGTYTVFGALHGRLWIYGIVIGLAASVASYLGKRILGEISGKTFRRLVIALVVVSGVVMLYRQLS